MSVYRYRVYDRDEIKEPCRMVPPMGNMAGIDPNDVAFYCEENGHRWFSYGEPYGSGILFEMSNEEWAKFLVRLQNRLFK